MENLRIALSLAFVAKQNISIYTDDYDHCIFTLKSVILRPFTANDVVEIDLRQYRTYDQIVSKMIKSSEGSMPSLYSVVLWENLEEIEGTLEAKSGILRIFNEIERHNTLAARNASPQTPIQLSGFSVVVPSLFMIVPIMKMHERTKFPSLHRQIKNHFWFCQSFYRGATQEILATEISRDSIMNARRILPAVYANAEIQEYICSLMVFTRSHRLCSLAPLTTRPTTRAAEGVLLLAKTLVVWANLDATARHFVTPDFVKVAFRKIGYWLVDWETNQVFQPDALSSLRKRTEISILTGDWYGSEWSCVEKYMDMYRAEIDVNSTTGFTNRIIEDVLKSVLPPL